jgi:hypothetical protein
MPDFNVEAHWCCETVRHWQATVEGHLVHWGPLPPQASVGYGMICDCKGYRFRGTCRHVKQAETMRCGWQAFVHGDEPTEDGKCPRCGGPVTAERYAV